jgi:hypothetical protein
MSFGDTVTINAENPPLKQKRVKKRMRGLIFGTVNTKEDATLSQKL